jgi:hypothetical protein
MPKWIHHGIVWTENVLLAASDADRPVLAELAQRVPIWGPSTAQVVLAPSITHPASPDLRRYFPSSSTPLILGPATPIDLLRTRDFFRYCADTLVRGVKRLHRELGDAVFRGPLGIIAPQSVRATTIIDELEKEKPEVRWSDLALGDGRCFYGPHLLQLAANHLVATEGIDPSRALCVVRLAPDRKDNLDYLLTTSVLSRVEQPLGGMALNIGDKPVELIPGYVPSDASVRYVDLGGQSADEKRRTLDNFAFVRPVGVPERFHLLLDRTTLLARLSKHVPLAASNLDKGKGHYHRLLQKKLPWNETSVGEKDPLFLAMFENGRVFDHRSGAISFDPYEWEHLRSSMNSDSPWGKVIQFFEEVIEEPWQRDRPNYRRILATPTKILLRGEEYYANLRNISPVRRLRELYQNTPVLLDQLKPELFSFRDQAQWKLTLGLLDQVRNAALQWAWFEHQMCKVAPFANEPAPALSRLAIEFLDLVAFVYYATLAGRRDEAVARLNPLLEVGRSLVQELDEVLCRIEKRIKGWRTDLAEAHLRATKLIRRWREADHPGENLLVALRALDDLPKTKIGIGVGWGGIELPVVYRQVAALIGRGALSVYAVSLSVYGRSSGSPEARPLSPGTTAEALSGQHIVVFDDNSLTGRTIEKVLEYLFTEHQTVPDAVYLTRISGERRYDQMRMLQHGMLNPDVVGPFICGHLGETPFARAWSRDDYENPIGVFSLAKRRILELLFVNSSVDRFEREGF